MSKRYADFLDVSMPNENVKDFTILHRDTDVFIPYHEADRLDLISDRYYGSPEYWWVILSANDYQLEFDIEAGEILRIPYPLNEVIAEIRRQVK